MTEGGLRGPPSVVDRPSIDPRSTVDSDRPDDAVERRDRRLVRRAVLRLLARDRGALVAAEEELPPHPAQPAVLGVHPVLPHCRLAGDRRVLGGDRTAVLVRVRFEGLLPRRAIGERLAREIDGHVAVRRPSRALVVVEELDRHRAEVRAGGHVLEGLVRIPPGREVPDGGARGGPSTRESTLRDRRLTLDQVGVPALQVVSRPAGELVDARHRASSSRMVASAWRAWWRCARTVPSAHSMIAAMSLTGRSSP